jgi:hypothetical protein
MGVAGFAKAPSTGTAARYGSGLPAEDGGALWGGDGAAGSGGVLAGDRSGGTVGGVRTGKTGGTIGGVSVMVAVDADPAPAVRAPAAGWVAG